MGATAVLEKPASREALHDTLIEIGLVPIRADQTLTVLVVDDDPKAVELTAVRLLGLATSVLRAGGGREAIEIATRELPDLIVLDLMMPDVNGFDVVESLQEDPSTAQIPILVVTAKMLSHEERERLSQNVTAIIEKAAFSRDRFIAEVRRATWMRRELTSHAKDSGH